MEDIKEILKIILTALLIFGAIIFGMMMIKSATCEAQWKGSGMTSDWGVVKGCMLQTKDGKWLPASAYRNID